MITPGSNEIEAYAKEFSIIPICKEIYGDIVTPISLLGKISQVSKKYYLLESIEGGKTWGRYLFLGFDPVMQITCKDNEITIVDEEKRTLYSNRPFDVLRDILAEYRAPKIQGMPPFTGGFVGYFAYEMIGYAESRLKLPKSDFNDFDLMLYDKVIAYDHLKQKITVVVNMKTDHIMENYEKAVTDIERIIQFINDPIPFSKLHTGSEEILKEIGLCFMFAPRYHSSMKYADPVRKELGVRTIFNILGPLGSRELGKDLAAGIYDTCSEIELVGICTDICVISNALLIKTFLPEKKITVDGACCAGITPKSHKNALEAMKMCHIDIIE